MTAGAFIGFIIFGVSYVFVVVSIFYDINKSKHEYLELVENDLNEINNLGVSASVKQEWNEELQLRLAGKAKDEGLDD